MEIYVDRSAGCVFRSQPRNFEIGSQEQAENSVESTHFIRAGEVGDCERLSVTTRDFPGIRSFSSAAQPIREETKKSTKARSFF